MERPAFNMVLGQNVAGQNSVWIKCRRQNVEDKMSWIKYHGQTGVDKIMSLVKCIEEKIQTNEIHFTKENKNVVLDKYALYDPEIK